MLTSPTSTNTLATAGVSVSHHSRIVVTSHSHKHNAWCWVGHLQDQQVMCEGVGVWVGGWRVCGWKV